MRILAIGDIVGKPGRKSLSHHLPLLKKRYDIDLVIANGENTAHGFGLTAKTAHELVRSGVDIITGGNHTWDRKEIIPLFDELPTLIRPANFYEGTAGRGYCIVDVGNERIGIINLLGMYGMAHLDNPFRLAPLLIQQLKEKGCTTLVIDFHAESTSEKYSLLRLLEGEITFLFGTHTHVGTDDLTIKNGTAFVCDVGLTGCRDGVIGIDPVSPLYRFSTSLHAAFEVNDKCQTLFQGVLVECEEGRATHISKLKAYGTDEAFISAEGYYEQF